MDDRTCDYCGTPLPPGARRNQRYCGPTHKRQARRQARRREEMQARLVTSSPPYADMSLSELDARRREHQASLDPGDDLRQFSDYGMLPGDDEQDDDPYPHNVYRDDDEQTARFRKLLREDEDGRVPRRSWTALKRVYARNPGIELRAVSQERVERHQAQQAAVQRRLRSSPMQPQDPFNEVTAEAVATRATASRQMNKAKATADPRPPAQRQSFAFEAEQAQGSFYRGGRAPGQESRHAAYQWNMTDGW